MDPTSNIDRSKQQMQQDIETSRSKLKEIQDRTINVLNSLENKVVNYFNTCKNMPAAEMGALFINGLNSLYKTHIDATSQLLRSYEKELDYANKTEDDTNTDEISFDDIKSIAKAMEKMKSPEKEINVDPQFMEC